MQTQFLNNQKKQKRYGIVSVKLGVNQRKKQKKVNNELKAEKWIQNMIMLGPTMPKLLVMQY